MYIHLAFGCNDSKASSKVHQPTAEQRKIGTHAVTKNAMYTSLTRFAQRPLRITSRRVVPSMTPMRMASSEVEHPNLGFEPGLLKDTKNVHDHVCRQ